MSYYSPVFFFLIDPSEMPSSLSSWHDAEPLISDRWDKRERQGEINSLVDSSSRNWWHQDLLRLICQAHGIEGLEFITQEIACLRKEALLNALQGFYQLFQVIETQAISQEIHNYEDIWNSQYLLAVNSRVIFTTHSRVMFTRRSRTYVYHPAG